MAENPILWVLKITGILILAAMLSAAGCEESPISPEGGFFDGPVDVTLNYPGATEIFYTLDGSEPGSNCLTYTQGDVITLDSSTVLKVRSKTAGADPEYSEISTATFSFVDNINPNNDTSTNRQALLAWVEYESTTRQVFADKYFGGCEPIVGCGGGLDLGQLGIYYICDVDNSITDPNACGNAGGGWISWEVTQQGLGGGSEFIYNNYSISLAEGGSLSATGAVVGRFDSGGSGSTNTDEGETITISGAYNASVDDAITVSSRAKSGGSYFISCTDAGCDNGGINYLVTAGPNFQRIEPSASSCATAPDFLRLQQEGLCLGKFSFGPFAGLEACNNDITNQQWDIVENFDTEAEDFHIVQKDTTGCLSAKPIDGSGLNGYDILTCIGNDPTQTFSFEKSEDAVGEEVRIVAAEGAIPGASGPLCLTTLSGTQVPIIIAQDCSDPAKDFDFSVVLGNTFPVEYLDPTTDLIPPPVPVSFDFSQFDGGYGISSLSFTEGDITVTATAINGQGVTQTAQGLGRGRGAFTYLMGRGEELNFSWSESVDIDAIVLNSYGDATVTWTYSDGTVSNNSHVDAKEGGYSTQLDLKDVTNVRVSANSNFVIVKGFNTVVPAQ
jgi:hypothetical protein